MYERIKLIRKSSKNEETGKIGYTQTEFAEKIGMSRSYLSQIEINDPNAIVSDKTISLICKEFDVNESWLRTGSGEMFKEKTRHEAITDFFADVLKEDTTTFKFRFINALAELPVEQWEMLADLCERIVNGKDDTK